MENKDDLGRKFSQGGEAELAEVIEQYGSRIFRYCFNTVCDYHAAEDITQQALIKAYKNRKSFRADATLSTWLYRIAYNCCIDYIRKRRFFLPLFEVKETSYASDAAEEEFSPDVIEALLRLTPKERAVVYGRIIEEKSYSELAKISNISEVALRKRYTRAKQKLANALRSSDIIKGRLQNETV